MAVRAVRAVGGVVVRGLARGAGGGHPTTPGMAAMARLTAGCQCQPQRHYAMRQELTEQGIVWRRPVYVPSWKPEKSGDLSAFVEPGSHRFKYKVMAATHALDQVDEVTRQLLSLKFGSVAQKVQVTRYDLLRDVQRHQYDTGSMESTIAMLTVRIRKAQQDLLTTTEGQAKTARKRHQLNMTIARRKKLLKHLRRMDYKRFEWLLNKLDILYRPPPRYVRWVTRKISLRRLVRMHGQHLRQGRLAAYRAELAGRREAFLKEKQEIIEWIAKTEADLGLPVSVEVPARGSVAASSSSSSSSSS